MYPILATRPIHSEVNLVVFVQHEFDYADKHVTVEIHHPNGTTIGYQGLQLRVSGKPDLSGFLLFRVKASEVPEGCLLDASPNPWRT